MTNPEIAAILDQIADLLEFKGENPFRVRAYRNAARTVNDLPRPVTEILADPEAKLTDIEGIGKDLAEKIHTLVDTRSLPMLEDLKAEIPESVLALMRIPGLGPKRAAILFKELNVQTLDELRAACETHRVQEIKGFGAKIESAILEGIGIASEVGKRFLWAEAEHFVREIVEHMNGCKAVKKIEAAGSFRRKKETIGDLDFLVVARDAAEVMEHFAQYPARTETLARGETKMSIRLSSKLQVDLRVVPAESFGAALQYFTGSKDHNIVLRGRAKDRKLKINEYGVFVGEKSIAGATEEDVYRTLDLPCFPPEIREARFEFQWADAGPLPKLVETDDIQGDLHMHSTWTDGLASIEEMVLAAKARGLKYVAITDHSKRTMMVGGLDGKRLREQWAEIDQLNERIRGIKVLKGVEVDILEQGGLDLTDDILAEADWIVASVHFGQKQSRERITRRILDALENPYVCAIAHPTGRLLLRRKPYEVDMETVLKAARDHGKCLELNAHPMRLDLDDVACGMARNYGVPVVISTDAHNIDGLDAMRYGVQQARRGGLTPADVANTRSWTQLKKRIGRR